MIEKEGIITPRNLSDKTGVSGSAISQWSKPLIKKGVLNWCDQNGDEFEEEKLLEGLGRVRTVKQGPDGYIYVGVENVGIVKIIPKK